MRRGPEPTGRDRAVVRPAPPGRSPQRHDVQGLRALAVVAVVAGHYGVPWLRGGYLGVDVFFVISGFLITQLLVREADRTGRVSLRDFYSRRARRILPAATLVTLLTLIASSLWISATDSLRVVTDAVWATFFLANIHFARVGTDYNQQNLSTSPLQHYWSLGVEEQFYVVWPLVLLGLALLARAARRRAIDGGARPAPRPVPRRLVVAALVVVAGSSFAYDVVRAASDPIATYFSTPARVWELAVGGLAALLVPVIARRRRPAVRQLLVVFGVAAVVVSCVTLDETTQSSTAAYLLPVVGTAAALLGGAGDGGDRLPAMRLIGVAPLRILGDWSYSLYLWHWPLLILALDDGPVDTTQRWLLAALALGLAGLTYRYVETPFRNPGRFPRPRALALYPVSVVVVCLSCALGSVYAHYRSGEFGDNPSITMSSFGVSDPSDYQFPRDPTKALVKASVIAAEHDLAVPSHLLPKITDLQSDEPDVGACDYDDPSDRNLCAGGDTSAHRTLVVLGNSHGRMWIPALEAIARQEHYRTYYFVKPNCSAADLQFADLDPETPLRPWSDCHDFREWAIDQIDRLHPAITIVSSTGPNPIIFHDGHPVPPLAPDRNRVVMDGFARTLRRLAPLTHRLVLLRDTPKPGFDPGTCLSSAGHDLGDCLFSPEPTSKSEARDSVRAAHHLGGVDVVDPEDWLCFKDTCPMVIGNMIPFRDTGHLSTVYAAYLAPELDRALGLATGAS